MGEAINLETGIFTAPVDGAYQFFVEGVKWREDSYGDLDLQAFKNGDYIT